MISIRSTEISTDKTLIWKIWLDCIIQKVNENSRWWNEWIWWSRCWHFSRQISDNIIQWNKIFDETKMHLFEFLFYNYGAVQDLTLKICWGRCFFQFRSSVSCAHLANDSRRWKKVHSLQSIKYRNMSTDSSSTEPQDTFEPIWADNICIIR